MPLELFIHMKHFTYITCCNVWAEHFGGSDLIRLHLDVVFLVVLLLNIIIIIKVVVVVNLMRILIKCRFSINFVFF